MKKILITLAFAVTGVTASFAGPATLLTGNETVNARVLNAFNKEFRSASDINWTIAENYYQVSFVYNEQYVSAYYNTDGELFGVARNISQEDLPLALQASLKKNYSDQWITDLFEVANANGTAYYITLENATSKTVLKAADGLNWKSFKKVTKI